MTTCYFPEFVSFLPVIHFLQEPKSYSEVIEYPEWKQIMNEELQAFQHSHTWDLVPLPFGVKPVSCKWIYNIKTQFDGPVKWYKARQWPVGFHRNMKLTMKRNFL